MEISLIQIGETKDSTLSRLVIDNSHLCFILEDGYREKKIMGVSRIPGGRYKIVPRTQGRFFENYKKRWQHKFVPHIVDVPNYEFILIHLGNTVNDTRGCLLPGYVARIIPKGNFCIEQSTPAYQELYKLMEIAFEKGEEVWINIVRWERA